MKKKDGFPEYQLCQILKEETVITEMRNRSKSILGYRLNLKGISAENFVYELSQKTFFTDWCYPNPKLLNGKEICDLLVVYDDTAVIWQIKDLKLDENGKYKKSEVDKNIHQLCSAKHRLFRLNVSIELENPRRGQEIFDPKPIKQVYLISALLGKAEDYFSFVETAKGSIIHTFTREFTEIVLKELDTIRDFVDYLREKEKLISTGKGIQLFGGEHELLAYYLMNQRRFEKLTKADVVVIEDGSWCELQKRPGYVAKKEEDTISYGWDDLINRAHTGGGEYEKVARELARANRFERRVLSKAFFDAHILAHKERRMNTFRRILKSAGVTYCFVFLDDPEPRTRRKGLLGAICFVARGLYQDHKKVIGVATEMKIRKFCSYDFCLIEIPEWTIERQREMEELQKKTGIFLTRKEKHVHEDEYPLSS